MSVSHTQIVQAQGDGYSGRYRFVRTTQGWCLKGEGGDYLTAGVGRSMYGETPGALLNAISRNRPKLQIRLVDAESASAPVRAGGGAA